MSNYRPSRLSPLGRSLSRSVSSAVDLYQEGREFVSAGTEAFVSSYRLMNAAPQSPEEFRRECFAALSAYKRSLESQRRSAKALRTLGESLGEVARQLKTAQTEFNRSNNRWRP